MTGAAFNTFVDPARVRPQLWRLVLGVVLLLGIYIGTVVLILASMWLVVGTDRADALYWVERMTRTDTPTSTLLILATFAGLALGAWAAARVMHKRSLATLFGPSIGFVKNFAISATVVGTIYAAILAIWGVGFDALPNLDFSLWLTFLPMAIAGLLLQTGAEELAFRGYLQQQLAARFASPIAWMILPSALFGLAHYNPEGGGATLWLVIGAATAFGLIAADLTARTGSIAAAWGFHFANNTVAILVLATEDTITGLSLYLTPYGIGDVPPIMFLGDFATIVVCWLILRRILVPRT